MKSKQIIVSGLVQGVGFRNFSAKIALKHGIVGWARNLVTSEVEILAIATENEALESFIAEIKKGPPRSRVDSLEIIDVDSKSLNCDTFQIESDGERKREF